MKLIVMISQREKSGGRLTRHGRRARVLIDSEVCGSKEGSERE